jgi:PHD/YefM family antitoxin component YafN of YafNO toxin-antitoxin module
MTAISSVEFDRDAARAQQMAEKEPVFIMENGTASHVLISIGDYRKLTGHATALPHGLSTDGIIEFEPLKAREIDFRPVEFD